MHNELTGGNKTTPRLEDANDETPSASLIPAAIDPAGRPLGRRALLAGAGATLVAVGCGGSSSGGDGSENASAGDASTGDDSTDNGAEFVAGEPASLVAYFAQQGGFVEAGIEQRIAVGVIDGENGILERPPEELTFRVVRDTGESDANGQPVYEVVTDPIPTKSRSEGLPRPYYPIRFTPPVAGIYQIGAEHNDRQLISSFQVSDGAEVPFPQPGDQVSGITTPTVVDDAGVDPICTRVPPCPFHEVSLDEAIGGDRPVVLMVSTPRFCATAVCGPVLDLLMEDIDRRGTSAPLVIHTEVFDKLTEDRVTTQMIDSLSLTYEPALFALKADGTVVDRLDNIFDATEIAETIDKLV